MDEGARIALAVLGMEADDPEVRMQSFRELHELCDEGVNDPIPYRILADVHLDVDPEEAWSLILHCAIRAAQLNEDDAKDVEAYSQAHNRCMKLGIKLKDAHMYEEATECFIIAMKWFFAAGGNNEHLEEFPDNAVGYAFYCAEEADDDPTGEMTAKVFEAVEECRGINDPD